MPIVDLKNISKQQFPNGATYQTIVGDEAGSTPVRVGVQISPPGYSTGTHSHPYMEIVSIIEGEGEAWMVRVACHPLAGRPLLEATWSGGAVLAGS